MTAAPEPWLDQRWTVNLSILFTELPLLRRPFAAADAGFDSAELWWPFADPDPPQAEVDALRRAFTDAGVRLTGLNFYGGDLAAGDRGVLSHPAGSPVFRDHIAVAVGLADSLGCRMLNALYGNRVDDVPVQEQDELALENLALAAHAAAGIGAVLLVEALNAVETPRYGLSRSGDAVAVVDAVNARTGLGNARLLADAYHFARGGEDPARVVTAYADRIGHVQIADSPGRGRPGSGSIDFPALFATVDAVGHQGLVGLEYRPPPGTATPDSLTWLPRALRRSHRGPS